MIDLEKVGGHYAVSSLFEEYPRQAKIYCYSADQEDFRLLEVGVAKLAVGRVQITSEITRETVTLNFGALHFGEQNLVAGVQVFQGQEAYEAMIQEVTEGFATGEIPETIRRMDRHFGVFTYSLKSLFRDKLRQVLQQIMEMSLEGTRFIHLKTYAHHASFMRFLTGLGIPLPEPLPCTADFVLNFNLGQAFEQPVIDREDIQNLLKEAATLKVNLNHVSLEFTLRRTLERLMDGFREAPAEFGILQNLEVVVGIARTLPFAVNLWKVQNIYYEMLQTVLPEWRWKAENGDAQAQRWVATFLKLGTQLSVKVD